MTRRGIKCLSLFYCYVGFGCGENEAVFKSDELAGWISDPENAASRAVHSHRNQTPDNPTGNAVCFLVYNLGSDRGVKQRPL